MRGTHLQRAILAGIVFTIGWMAHAQVQFPEKPGGRDFIVDEANLLTEAQEDAIRKRLDKLLTDMGIPIIVVTIKAKADYGASGISLDDYATKLYDHWGIGHNEVKVKGRGMGRSKVIDWNKGFLFLVSIGDRKLRIEVGGGWGNAKDAECKRIVTDVVVPKFKKKDFSGGLSAGVVALEKIARQEPIPNVPRPWWHYALVVGGVLLTIGSFVSMVRTGRSGWGWALWAVLLSILWFLIVMILTRRSSGFGGGSFGGGSSGGGGASGSW